MAITVKINQNDFIDAFMSIRPKNFSLEGLSCLYEYLEDLSDDLGTDIELDVIAICCERSEVSKEDLIMDYGNSNKDDIIADLENKTTLFKLKNGNYLIAEF